jgi:hypothetical protein
MERRHLAAMFFPGNISVKSGAVLDLPMCRNKFPMLFTKPPGRGLAQLIIGLEVLLNGQFILASYNELCPVI